MSTAQTQQLKQMRAYQRACHKLTREIEREMRLPLKVNDKGQITQGVVWIGLQGPHFPNKPKRRRRR